MLAYPGRCLGLASLLAVALLAHSVVVEPCAVAGLTAVAAPEADYFERADEVLGATRSPALAAWLPYGIAITNRTPRGIAAIAVRWVVTNAKGQEAVFTVTPSLLEQPRQQMAPGKSVIALPDGVLGITRLPAQFQLTPATGAAGPNARLSEFQSAISVRAAIDGVVFSSGQFVGPNLGKEYEEFVAETTVPARVASTVIAMQASGETPATVAAWLEAGAKSPVHPGDWTAQISAQTAKLLLRSYQRGGEELLYEVAQGYAQGPGIKVFR